jgi:hypothetical protein
VLESGKVKMIAAGYRSGTGCSLPIDRPIPTAVVALLHISKCVCTYTCVLCVYTYMCVYVSIHTHITACMHVSRCYMRCGLTGKRISPVYGTGREGRHILGS